VNELQANAINPAEIGKFAMRDLENMSIPPVPACYEVWFAHLQKLNKELSADIEEKLSAGQSIDEVFLKNIHGKYFQHTEAASYLDDYASQLLSHTKNLHNLANKFDSSTKALNEDLDNAAKAAERDPQALLEALLDAAKTAFERNAELEKNLSQASSKIESLQEAVEEIANDANTDFLTKLSNRRHFDNVLNKMIEETIEDDAPLCMIVTDIDHFKKFNDTWGHQIGDQVLKLVASTLRENVKGQDQIARYGGEEFVIALPHTEIGDAMKLAENIRIAISKKRLVNKANNDDLGKITMSFGVSKFAANLSAHELFQRADSALYNAKQTGRNKVCCFSKPE